VSYISGFLIPIGRLDCVAVSVLAFGVGIQIQLTRRVNGVEILTTMCTGSLRSLFERLAKYTETRDKSLLIGIYTYLFHILAFIVGVTVSALIIVNL
jgi:uncharacterized membrane protein YoaK (UPF0700 family)